MCLEERSELKVFYPEGKYFGVLFLCPITIRLCSANTIKSLCREVKFEKSRAANYRWHFSPSRLLPTACRNKKI
jgi:hypothetical protein